MNEMYVHFSHFNFNADEWREAAKRYVDLCKRIREIAKFDDDIDHDALGENFISCDVCEELRDLEDRQEEFAKEFAHIWAAKIIELTKEAA